MKKTTAQKLGAVLIPAVLSLAIAAPAFAATSKTAATAAQKLEKLRTTETAAIDKRISDLNALIARINDMKKVDDATKTTLATNIQTTINSLNSLKAKIATETDATALKNDDKELLGGTRVYALVEPQARILAAAERALTTADMLTAMQTKLQARIDAAKAAGKDTTAMAAALTDMTAKIADAKTQAQAAITAVKTLVPDNGVSATMQANTQALKTGRADLLAAEKDLSAAAKDAKTITGAFKKNKIDSEDANKTGDTNTTSPSTATPENH